jgi:hypothetical protein
MNWLLNYGHIYNICLASSLVTETVTRATATQFTPMQALYAADKIGWTSCAWAAGYGQALGYILHVRIHQVVSQCHR